MTVTTCSKGNIWIRKCKYSVIYDLQTVIKLHTPIAPIRPIIGFKMPLLHVDNLCNAHRQQERNVHYSMHQIADLKKGASKASTYTQTHTKIRRQIYRERCLLGCDAAWLFARPDVSVKRIATIIEVERIS
jgi:hypothetical protein